MAGVTDLPFRCLCKEQGASLIYTEMVSAKGILYNNKNTKIMLETAEAERPVALQLFGEDATIMSEVAKRIEELPFDILDINMGCPVPKVVNNGEGSALMKDPVKAGRIIEAIAKAIKKPVTVKIRKGFGKEDANAPELAKIAEESGAAAVAGHEDKFGECIEYVTECAREILNGKNGEVADDACYKMARDFFNDKLWEKDEEKTTKKAAQAPDLEMTEPTPDPEPETPAEREETKPAPKPEQGQCSLFDLAGFANA